MSLPLSAGDLNSLLPDEDGRRLYISMKDNLLSASLDDITQPHHKVITCSHVLAYLSEILKGSCFQFFHLATVASHQWHHLAYLCVSTRSYVVRAAIYPNITIYWGRSSVIKVLSPEGCELIAVRRDKSSECYIKFIWKVKMMYLSILREITYE